MAQPASHSIRLPASTEELARLRSFIDGHCPGYGFSEQAVNKIKLAADEAFTNIIKHAYGHDAPRPVSIELHFSGNQVQLSLFDTGTFFSLDAYENPNIKQKIARKERGGVGVYLIKKMMDEVSYIRHADKNEIRMIKYQ